jgi:hypothetical protein
MICPKCGNADKVYDHGTDPIVGSFVLCMTHGIQVCEKKVEQMPKQPEECLICGAGCKKIEQDVCFAEWED